MKKFMLLIAALLICALPAAAENAGALRLPGGLREIQAEAFLNDTSIGEVILPGGVTAIGERAFAGSSITSINLPDKITFIAENAFDDCGDFTAIVNPGSYAEDYCTRHGISIAAVPNSPSDFAYVYRGTDEISIVAYYGAGKNVNVPETINGCKVTAVSFEDCSEIRSVILPDTITALSPRAFAGCVNLKRITLPPEVDYIPTRAFDGCASLESIVFSENITTIGNYAFRDCTALKEIEFPESMTSLGKGAFSGCTALEKIDLPVNITAVPDEAFRNCTALESLTLPERLSAIGKNAFEKCENLESPVFPESLRSVGENAFLECYRMEIIPLPGNITHIGEYAFFTQPGFGVAPGKIQCSLGSETANTIFVINAEFKDLEWSEYEINDPAFSDYFFIGHTDETDSHSLILTQYIGSAEDLTLPDAIAGIPVVDIRYSCFENCVSLKKVTLPAWLKTIPSYAFHNCTNLEEVIIPEGVTYIDDGAFSGCSSLKYCRIPESVIGFVGQDAFATPSFPTTTTLIVVENSAAHRFCIEHNDQPFILAE